MEKLEAVVNYLKDNRLLLAVAESCTAGLVVAELARIPGSGQCLEYGLTVYSPAAKNRFLGVGIDVIERHGLTSEAGASIPPGCVRAVRPVRSPGSSTSSAAPATLSRQAKPGHSGADPSHPTVRPHQPFSLHPPHGVRHPPASKGEDRLKPGSPALHPASPCPILWE